MVLAVGLGWVLPDLHAQEINIDSNCLQRYTYVLEDPDRLYPNSDTGIPDYIVWAQTLEDSLVAIFDDFHPEAQLTRAEKVDSAFAEVEQTLWAPWEWRNYIFQRYYFKICLLNAEIIKLKPQQAGWLNKMHKNLSLINNHISTLCWDFYQFFPEIFAHHIQYYEAWYRMLQADYSVFSDAEIPEDWYHFTPVPLAKRLFLETCAYRCENLPEEKYEDENPKTMKKNEIKEKKQTRQHIADMESALDDFIDTRENWDSGFFHHNTSQFILDCVKMFSEDCDW